MPPSLKVISPSLGSFAAASDNVIYWIFSIVPISFQGLPEYPLISAESLETEGYAGLCPKIEQHLWCFEK